MIVQTMKCVVSAAVYIPLEPAMFHLKTTAVPTALKTEIMPAILVSARSTTELQKRCQKKDHEVVRMP